MKNTQNHLINSKYLLHRLDGYGFKHNSTITVLDQVNGNKVGWPMGAILYEINSLPWELEQPVPREPWGKFFCAAFVGQSVDSLIFPPTNYLYCETISDSDRSLSYILPSLFRTYLWSGCIILPIEGIVLPVSTAGDTVSSCRGC